MKVYHVLLHFCTIQNLLNFTFENHTPFIASIYRRILPLSLFFSLLFTFFFSFSFFLRKFVCLCPLFSHLSMLLSVSRIQESTLSIRHISWNFRIFCLCLTYTRASWTPGNSSIGSIHPRQTVKWRGEEEYRRTQYHNFKEQPI